jgi:hypothetical protein
VVAVKPRKDEEDRFRLSFFNIGGIAALSGLLPDTIFLLTKKGVFNPLRKDGKMIFKRGDVERWIRERG